MTPSPKPYQNTGIDFLAARSDAMLGDDAGLGKSLQIIRGFERARFERGLIVCPAIGRVSWADQLATWQTRRRPFYFYPDQTAGVIPEGPHWLVVTFEWLSRRKQAIKMIDALRGSTAMDLLAVDEGHYVKTPEAWRTRAVYGPRLDFQNSVGETARAHWIASATFTPNHAGELYPHLMAVLPDVLRSLFNGKLPTQAEFEQRFCQIEHTPYGVKVVGNKRDAIPALRAALAPHILVRRKEDVLQDLEPIRPVLLPLPVTVRADPVDAEIETMLGALDTHAGADADLSALNNLPGFSTRRRELGEAKVMPAAQWIADFLSAPGKKLVVFAHHVDVLEELRRLTSWANPAMIYGRTPSGQRAAEVMRFQSDPACRLFLGQNHAAGTSITLTAASDVLLLEPDPTPDVNYQDISRCHRIGQAGSVTAYFASAAGTVDDAIARRLRRKAGDNVQLFGGTLRGVA